MTQRIFLGIAVLGMVVAFLALAAAVNQTRRPVDCAAIADGVALSLANNPAAQGQPFDRQRVLDACRGRKS